MKNYLIFLICFIFITAGMSCKKKHTIPKVPSPSWTVDNTGKYPVSMTAVVQVPENLRTYIQPEDKIGAFVGDECRGIGQLVQAGSVSAFFIMIHGEASEQNKISFRYWDSWRSNLYSTDAFLDFTVDGTYGSPDAPAILKLKPVMHK